jgi:hypothetical protein
MKHNDLNIEDWKELDINTDSLWLIKERDKSGKHANVCHGNFIPQIPNQLIRRYSKKNETIFEPFMGSGTTLFECEKLDRKYIGFDINPKIVDYVQQKVEEESACFIGKCNSLDEEKVDLNFSQAFEKTIEVGTKPDTNIKIKTPIIHLTKAEIVKKDLELNAPLQHFVVVLSKRRFGLRDLRFVCFKTSRF